MGLQGFLGGRFPDGLESQQTALPRKQNGGGRVGSRGFQCGFRRHDGGIELDLAGHLVAVFAELIEAVDLFLGGADPNATDDFGPFLLLECQRGLESGLKTIEAWLRDAWALELSSLGGILGEAEKILVGEDVEGGAVPGACLGVAPVPERAKDPDDSGVNP